MIKEYYRTIKNNNNEIVLHEVAIDKDRFDVKLADLIGSGSGEIDASDCICALYYLKNNKLLLKRECTGNIKLMYVVNGTCYYTYMDIASMARLLFGYSVDGEYINMQQATSSMYVIKVYNDDFIDFHVAKEDAENLIDFLSTKHDYKVIISCVTKKDLIYKLELATHTDFTSFARLHRGPSEISGSFDIYRIGKFIFNKNLFVTYYQNGDMIIHLLDDMENATHMVYSGYTNVICPDMAENYDQLCPKARKYINDNPYK